MAKENKATSLVPGVGPVPCAGMIIGEAPGAEEERQGVPFVGASGYLLDESLAAVGLHRNNVYVTNVYKYRPEGNRNPTSEEIEEHRELLDDELEKVNPQTILLLGRVARDALLERLAGSSMASTRGKIYESPSGRDVLVSWHPAYILYSGGRKTEAYMQFLEDLQMFAEAVNDTEERT